MRYRTLGKSGCAVSELCLGTMTFGNETDEDGARAQLDRFVEAGGNFVDTANNYTDGTSERFVGGFVASDRERFVVATKYSLSLRKDDPNAGGNHRKNMRQAIEGSLRRLGTDYVDVLWLHMWDYMTPVEEVIRSFDDLVRSGKVSYVGFSDTPAWVVARAVALAEAHGWVRPVAVQAPYSLADRGVERELLPMARTLDLAVAAWGLLEGGELTGKYSSGSNEPKRYGEQTPGERVRTLAKAVANVAEEVGRSPSQVAINWVRQQQARAEIIPIIGARTEVQMKDNLAVLEFELTAEQLETLTAAVRFDQGFPDGFLRSDHVHGIILGDTCGLIDDPRA
jgi:aryl-alcohol dehydrogenase-like predicted oxidoreductase